jgi:tripartite-type tricarboxylate transporter receptor subunit TctC
MNRTRAALARPKRESRRAALRIVARAITYVGLLGLGVATQSGHAQRSDFPTRPFRFIVPFPPGSGTDLAAREFGKQVSELAGQPVVVENRSGGNGFIAVQAVLSAPPDGYTVFIGSNSTLPTNVALFKALPYDPIADFFPLSGLIRSPAMVIVPPASPYKTIGGAPRRRA